jgi:hypothetical protein
MEPSTNIGQFFNLPDAANDESLHFSNANELIEHAVKCGDEIKNHQLNLEAFIDNCLNHNASNHSNIFDRNYLSNKILADLIDVRCMSTLLTSYIYEDEDDSLQDIIDSTITAKDIWDIKSSLRLLTSTVREYSTSLYSLDQKIEQFFK